MARRRVGLLSSGLIGVLGTWWISPRAALSTLRGRRRFQLGRSCFSVSAIMKAISSD